MRVKLIKPWKNHPKGTELDVSEGVKKDLQELGVIPGKKRPKVQIAEKAPVEEIETKLDITDEDKAVAAEATKAVRRAARNKMVPSAPEAKTEDIEGAAE